MVPGLVVLPAAFSRVILFPIFLRIASQPLRTASFPICIKNVRFALIHVAIGARVFRILEPGLAPRLRRDAFRRTILRKYRK